ncbi:C-type lectin domain family 4 member F-like [Clupea harengus]|uniref:C-type lectin domain family 4 member F-like n=1 Tax=Clupea harengus TaxID=7950 RepID=A0A8M1KV05_CLUHA|nr:C-type lectin domain family 4 member F-like [Clupea harengus]
MLLEQKNSNDDLTKENTELKNELQVWEYFDGACYHFSTDKKNWTESIDACVTMGGHLVIINSQQEMDFLKDKTEHWIGLTDAQEEGTWRWVDNTPLTDPKFWAQGQPNNHKGYDPDGQHCAMIKRGEWHDRSCGYPYKIICETKSCRAGG